MVCNPSSGFCCGLERCPLSNNTINVSGCFVLYCQINICFSNNELDFTEPLEKHVGPTVNSLDAVPGLHLAFEHKVTYLLKRSYKVK